MKRYIKSYDMSNFDKYDYRHKCSFAPIYDEKKPYKNLIPYAGDKLSKKIYELAQKNDWFAWRKPKIVDVDLSTLQTIQPYIFEEGLDMAHTGPQYSNMVFAVRYRRQIYIMNGNHRVVKAILSGEKTYTMPVYNLG